VFINSLTMVSGPLTLVLATYEYFNSTLLDVHLTIQWSVMEHFEMACASNHQRSLSTRKQRSDSRCAAAAVAAAAATAA
jgi:hypothetical protein